MAVEVFALCEGASTTAARAFVWENVFRGVTPDRLLLTSADSYRFVRTLGEGKQGN
jgi:hypothetical protein